jgi:hypothetical protein
MRILLILTALLVFSYANAETYRDIGPLDNLGDIKKKFKNANIEKLSPGWANEADALYKVTGTGISGVIIIKFDDLRSYYKEAAEKDTPAELTTFFQEMSQKSDEEAMTVNWVRWIPDTTIPIQRLISKYGKPDQSGFSDENFQPYRWWNRGLEVYLSDDEKNVDRIDFIFTDDEHRKAYLSKYKIVPYWLKEKPIQRKKK